jgi:RecA/RadA recombinase
METMPRLTSGLPTLDESLLGGIEEGSIIEFYGPARGGKTQWVSLYAVRAQLPVEEGGLGGRILWLDSESSFKPWIIRANALRFGLDPEVTLGNIGRAEIFLSGQINEIFESIPQMCAEQNYKFVVLDSFTGLFRAEYTGLDKLKLRQQDMNSVLNQMRRTAAATGATFAYTNQVMANISLYGGNPNHPIGGHVLSHASDYRFYVKRRMKDERVISLQDNAGVPEFEVRVHVGWGGFYEASKDKKDTEPRIIESLGKSGKAGFGDAQAEVEETSKEEVEAEAA